MREIKNVTVDKISILTDWTSPAVPKAETKFALFKTRKKYLKKAQELYNKVRLSKSSKDKLDKIIALEKNVIESTPATNN